VTRAQGEQGGMRGLGHLACTGYQALTLTVDFDKNDL
jgi:hypothetical protein